MGLGGVLAAGLDDGGFRGGGMPTGVALRIDVASTAASRRRDGLAVGAAVARASAGGAGVEAVGSDSGRPVSRRRIASTEIAASPLTRIKTVSYTHLTLPTSDLV